MPPITTLEPEVRTREALARRWNVVLLDDDDHTYDYVIEMLGRLFGHNVQRAYRLAVELDTTGRVIVWTGCLEVAELKQDQILQYGADPRIAQSAGSMSAVVEVAD